MQTVDLFLFFLMVLLGLITLLTIKISRFIRKVEKLYDYFIRPESEIDKMYKELEESGKPLPPMNGECPTLEALDKLP